MNDDDKAFVKRLNEIATSRKLSAREIAIILRVSVPTVDRWLAGLNTPHPLARPGIFRSLAGEKK